MQLFHRSEGFLICSITLLQAESMIPADYMIGVEISRGLRDGKEIPVKYGYFVFGVVPPPP